MNLTERENILRMFQGKEPCWLPLSSRSMYSVGKLITDIERPHTKEGYDWFGVHWLPQNAFGRVITHPDVSQTPIVQDITNWREELKFPDIDALDWDAFQRDVNEDAKNLNGRLPFIRLENGLWERMTLLMGFENALVALLLEPDACREYAEAMADFKIKLHDRMLDLYPYDLAIYMEDLGSTKGPLMSLETYRSIFKEPVRRVLSHIKAKGPHVGFHSCGRMEMFVEDIIDMGAEVLNTVQIWNDQAALKERFGKQIIFYGGLNNQQITEAPYPEESQIRAEVHRVVDTLAHGGGLIIEMRNASTALNGVDVSAILYDEFERYTKGLYPENPED